MLFEPGADFGGYRLLRRLGQGGFAEVWLARQTGRQGFERRVALKVLNAYRSDDDRSLETLVNEARVGGALEHPNIVQVFAIDEVDGTWFVAMEFVEGPDLGVLVRALSGAGLRMPPSIVVGIGLQIARALEYAHAATDMEGRPLNLVHRDLKPPNVLVSRKGAVKVTDFGIAKATTNVNSTSTGTVKGTPLYMAPELWAGEREFHPRIDLFALGAMLVELATGQRLLQGDTAAAIAGQAIFGDPAEDAARLDDVLPALAPVVCRMLQRKPMERTQDAAEVVGELQQIAREIPTPGDLSLFVQLVDVLKLPVPERSDALSTLRLPIGSDAAWSRLVTAARGDRVEPDPILARPVPSLLVEQLVGGGRSTATKTAVHPDAAPVDTRAETAVEPSTRPGARPAGVDTVAVTAALAETRLDPGPKVGATRIVPATPEPARPRWPWIGGALLVGAIVLAFVLLGPDPSETVEPSPTPSPERSAPTPVPAPSPEPTTTPEPARTATPWRVATPAPTPGAVPTPTPTPTATSTPEPEQSPVAVQATRGCISFASDPPGAEVEVDGQTATFVARRRSPPLRSYEPGAVRVVMGRGDEAVSVTIQVRAGVQHAVRCDLGDRCTVTDAGSCP